ncbi:MAG: DoxX family protein [Anaerolineales bacterium]
MVKVTATNYDVGILVLRFAVAIILLFHGVYKLTHGVEWIRGPLGELGLPGFLAYGTYLAEIVAPLLLIAGVATRAAALVIAFDMLMAIVLVLRPQLTAIKPGGGGWAIELEALLLLSSLALFFTGAGIYRVGRGRGKSGTP